MYAADQPPPPNCPAANQPVANQPSQQVANRPAANQRPPPNPLEQSKIYQCPALNPFYFLCCITGQFFIDICDADQCRAGVYCISAVTLTVLSYIFCIGLLAINLGSLIFDLYMYVIGWCRYKNCTYFCARYSNARDLLDVYLATLSPSDDYNVSYSNDTGTGSGLLGITLENISAYSNWNKTVITTATIAGFLSYYLMIFLVLLPLYSSLLSCKPRQHRRQHQRCGENSKWYKNCLKFFCKSIKVALFDKKDYLLPFNDDKRCSNKQSTALELKQAIYFYLIYSLNLVLFAGTLGLFIYIMIKKVTTTDEKRRAINESGLMCQFLSQLCAIQSCFIFSKVAYAMSNNTKDMIEKFKMVDFSEQDIRRNGNDNQVIDQGLRDMVNGNQGEVDHLRLKRLKELDKEFIDQADASIKPYRHWFAVHWALYTITAFMSTALFAEKVARDIYIPSDKETWIKNPKELESTIYIFLFTLEHIFLFLYPCFRAAQITRARVNLIKKFSQYSWKHLSLPSQTYFINYLKAQNFGFRMSIACIDVTFGFNLAFVSIFVGVFGVILKFSL